MADHAIGGAILRWLESRIELAARVELRAHRECLEHEAGRAWRHIEEILRM